MSESTVEVTFALDDPSLDDQERQEFAKRLLKQLREKGDAESIERTDDLNLILTFACFMRSSTIMFSIAVLLTLPKKLETLEFVE